MVGNTNCYCYLLFCGQDVNRYVKRSSLISSVTRNSVCEIVYPQSKAWHKDYKLSFKKGPYFQ